MSSAPAGGEPKSFGRAFAIGIALNLGYVLIEGGYGFVSNSMALIADAGHNLSDVLGLGIAWGAALVSKRLPTKRFTYGLRGSSILAALPNAIVLLIAVGAIGWEAIRRFSFPRAGGESDCHDRRGDRHFRERDHGLAIFLWPKG